jgi:hypothetical protein
MLHVLLEYNGTAGQTECLVITNVPFPPNLGELGTSLATGIILLKLLSRVS